MMETGEIYEIAEKISRSETTETGQHRPVREEEIKERKCIYHKDEVCTAPECKFKECANCAYGYMYTFAGALKDIFRRVVALAIFLIKGDDLLKDIISVMREVELELSDGARSRKNVRKLDEKVQEIARKIKEQENPDS